MIRREFLKLLGLAPVALPIATSVIAPAAPAHVIGIDGGATDDYLGVTLRHTINVNVDDLTFISSRRFPAEEINKMLRLYAHDERARLLRITRGDR